MLDDFWGFGTASDGCIAGAKPSGYMHIDWDGKVTPCVFVPYSAGNINEISGNDGTLDDVYELPYMKAICHIGGCFEPLCSVGGDDKEC